MRVGMIGRWEPALRLLQRTPPVHGWYVQVPAARGRAYTEVVISILSNEGDIPSSSSKDVDIPLSSRKAIFRNRSYAFSSSEPGMDEPSTQMPHCVSPTKFSRGARRARNARCDVYRGNNTSATGCGMRDTGCGIRDAGCGMRVVGVGPVPIGRSNARPVVGVWAKSSRPTANRIAAADFVARSPAFMRSLMPRSRLKAVLRTAIHPRMRASRGRQSLWSVRAHSGGPRRLGPTTHSSRRASCRGSVTFGLERAAQPRMPDASEFISAVPHLAIGR